MRTHLALSLLLSFFAITSLQLRAEDSNQTRLSDLSDKLVSTARELTQLLKPIAPTAQDDADWLFPAMDRFINKKSRSSTRAKILADIVAGKISGSSPMGIRFSDREIEEWFKVNKPFLESLPGPDGKLRKVTPREFYTAQRMTQMAQEVLNGARKTLIQDDLIILRDKLNRYAETESALGQLPKLEPRRPSLRPRRAISPSH